MIKPRQNETNTDDKNETKPIQNRKKENIAKSEFCLVVYI